MATLRQDNSVPAAATVAPAPARVILRWVCRLFLFVLGGSSLLAASWLVLQVRAAPAELFFSEYMVNAGTNQVLEIYNGTGLAIELADEGYDVQLFFDGEAEARVTVPLTGTCEAGDVYILAADTADPLLLAAADQRSADMFFDGNDAVVLRRNETIIDVIGQIGFNPGDAWGNAPVRTEGYILRRKGSIEAGDFNGTDPFEPVTEWEGSGLDDLAGLGNHAITPEPTSTPEPTFTPTETAVPAFLSPTISPEIATGLPTETPLPDSSATPTSVVTVFSPTPPDPTVTPTELAESSDVMLSPAPMPPAPALIAEFLYAGLAEPDEGDEFIELCNPNVQPLDLTGYKIGDETWRGGGEGMYDLPSGVNLSPDACLLIAKNAEHFYERFTMWPDFEVVVEGSGYRDQPFIPNLTKYHAWSSGTWSLANSADEIVVLGPGDEILDSVAYGDSDYASLNLTPDASAAKPYSLQRIWPIDTDSMAHDFVRALPSPGSLTLPPHLPQVTIPPATLPDGMNAYWGHLHAHSSYSDGAGPPFYALAQARAAGLHFYVITDPGSALTTQEWVETLAQVENAAVPAQFVALRGVEWTLEPSYHLTIFNSETLPSAADPLLDTLPELDAWFLAHPETIGQLNHPGKAAFDHFLLDSGTSPWLFLQEIGYAAQENTRYEAAFLESLGRGWRVAPTANGGTLAADWGSDTLLRTGIVAPALTTENLLDAIRARRVFATEDNNLALALRVGGVWMGNVLASTGVITVTVDFVDPDPEPLALFLYDGTMLLETASFSTSTGQWITTVNAWPNHYFWLKATQADGQTAYSAPVWVEGQLPLENIYLNEILPAPKDRDWNGDGAADQQDEWIELFNPTDHMVDLTGWQLSDASSRRFTFPPGTVIPPGRYVTFYRNLLGLALNNDEDTITLANPGSITVDQFNYIHGPGYNGSWCRLPDGASHWSDACEPSPNAPNWEKNPDGPLTVNIFEAKRLTPGAWIRIKGRVTAPPGILGARNMYIQDSTAGILIYLPRDHRLYFNLGDRVQVEGKLRLAHEEFEVAVEERDNVKFLEPGQPPPPLPIATTSLLEPYEGLLVMLEGRIARLDRQATFWLDDGTGEAKTYVRQSTGIKKNQVTPGVPATVIGIVSQYSDKDSPSRNDYRLLPRFQTDLVISAAPLPPANWPTTLPETGG